MKGEVAWPRARLAHKRGLGQAGEPALVGFEPVADYLVGAQVHGEGEGVGRVWQEAMGVRPVLVLVRPAPLVLVGGGGRGQLPVGRHWQQAHAAAHVVGHQGGLAGVVEADVAGRPAARGLLAEQREGPGARGHGKSAHAPAAGSPKRLGFAHRVQKAPAGRQRQVGGAGAAALGTHAGEDPGGRAETVKKNGAVPFAGHVGAHIHQAVAGRRVAGRPAAAGSKQQHPQRASAERLIEAAKSGGISH